MYKIVIDKDDPYRFKATLYKRWWVFFWMPVASSRAVFTTSYVSQLSTVVIRWMKLFNISPNSVIDKTNLIIK